MKANLTDSEKQAIREMYPTGDDAAPYVIQAQDYISRAAAAWLERGRELERAAVVAWLRGAAESARQYNVDHAKACADACEMQADIIADGGHLVPDE